MLMMFSTQNKSACLHSFIPPPRRLEIKRIKKNGTFYLFKQTGIPFFCSFCHIDGKAGNSVNMLMRGVNKKREKIIIKEVFKYQSSAVLFLFFSFLFLGGKGNEWKERKKMTKKRRAKKSREPHKDKKS
eukprot:TRINITY_DN1248_c0_g1_i1.p1 TRINITY_DN1248_c0_g1~~TRINITY_DN1248_c0_g1_i1.p1  ORF type:complete len:129 (-),score=2.55 TRINITY_DN1248_c0_g1_i1:54-440(-)